jgi:hypothetical protein
MIETLRIYIAQRFSSLMFLSLAVFLFLYSVPFHALHPLSLVDVLKVFLMLWVMRLYDDVMQWENDAEFSDRIYTHSESRSKLILPLVLSMATSVCISWSDSPDFSMASLWLYFIIVNHVLYKALVHRNFWAFVLPLIKYPFLFFYMSISYAISEDVSYVEYSNAITLFLVFVIYDLLDNRSAERPVFALYFLIVICFILLFLTNVNAIALIGGVALLVIALILVHLKKEVIPILWLLLILIFKLILNNYVI